MLPRGSSCRLLALPLDLPGFPPARTPDCSTAARPLRRLRIGSAGGVAGVLGVRLPPVGPAATSAPAGHRSHLGRCPFRKPRHSRANLPSSVGVEHGPVERVLASAYDEPFDVVVLDPPREGARRKVVTQIVDRAPRAVAYVACDPAALARDVATFAGLGYSLRELRAFDLFPMTHHVECVALLERR